MPEKTVVDQLVDKVVEYMRTLTYPAANILAAVKYVVDEAYSDTGTARDFPKWTRRYIELGGGKVMGDPRYWSNHVYPGGYDYPETLANLVRAYTAAAVEHVVLTDPACADLLVRSGLRVLDGQ